MLSNKRAYRQDTEDLQARLRRAAALHHKMTPDAYVAEREERLLQALATVADVSWNPKTGKMEISYRDSASSLRVS